MKKVIIFLASILIIGLCALPAFAQSPETGQHVGDVILYAGDGSSPPYGFLRCDGSAVSRSTYAGLFAIIGTKYGGGNGLTTFNIPNTSGMFVLGSSGESSGYTSCGNEACFLQRGANGGVYGHQLTVNEIPAHRHYFAGNAGGTPSAMAVTGNWAETSVYQTSASGGGAAHNNMPPYLSMYYLIAYTTSITNAAPTATPTTQPTYTPAATYTPAPTYTPQPTYTPEPTYTPNPAGVISTPVDAYTHTLDSGNTVYLPLIITTGQMYLGFILLSLGLIGVAQFMIRFYK